MRLLKRIDVTVSGVHIKMLAEMAKKTGISKSEVIRRAIEQHYRSFKGKEQK